MAKMETLSENVIEPIERGFLKIGVDSAGKAGVVVALGLSVLQFVVKPSFAFDKATGQPRPFEFGNLDPGNPLPPTKFPWYLNSMMAGYLVTLFI